MANRSGSGFGRRGRRRPPDDVTDDSELGGAGTTSDGEDLFGFGSMAAWMGPPATEAAPPPSGTWQAAVAPAADDVISPLAQQDWSLIRLDQMRADARFDFLDGRGLAVVVIDSGIDLNHGFFGGDANGDGIADRIVYNYDYYHGDSNASDFNGHGSNVASIVGSSDATYTGMAPGVNIIALKVFPDGSGSALASGIQAALDWVVANRAAYKIVSVNMSLGVSNTFYNVPTSTPYSSQMASLVAAGTAVVVASGNSYTSWQGVSTPSADPSAWSIGAVWDRNAGSNFLWNTGVRDITTGPDRIVSFSQRSTAMTTIFAPGGQITGASWNGATNTQSGTSQAAPHVAGLVPLMQQMAMTYGGRFLSVDELETTMLNGAATIYDGDDENDNVVHTYASYKRVDAYGWAIQALSLVYAGTTGVDSLMGTVLGDVIHSNAGNDGLNGMSGDDVLFGDAGNDFLNGASGNDTLSGGAGADYYYFAPGYGQDTVADFVQSDGDRIDLTSFAYVHSLHQVYVRSMQVGANTLIDLGGGDTLTLSNFTRTNLASGDFDFRSVSIAESIGTTTVAQVGSGYFLDSSGGAEGPQLRLDGSAFVVGSNGDWRIIGAEQQPNGYAMWWKNGVADQYVMWSTDLGGNFVSNGPLVNAISYRLQSLEPAFGQDLNGDTTIGTRSTVVESAGSTNLAIVGDLYFMYQGSGAAGATLRQNGDYIGWGMSPWAVLGVERWSGGYQVAWKNGSANEYAIWTTDILGNFWSSSSLLNSSSYALQSLETAFGQNLNGDMTIGTVSVEIESSGTTKLARVADLYFMYQGSGTSGAVLQQNGSYVVAVGGAWTALGVERWSDGYQVVWKNDQADQYALWTTDLNGNFLSSSNAMSGSSAALQGLEVSFNQDFNSTGMVGMSAPLESAALGRDTAINDATVPDMSLFTNYLAAAFATPAGEGTGVTDQASSSDQDYLAKPMA